MQAIQSKYLPATNHKGSRIKAWCERGSITISYPHELSGDACHIAAVDALIAKFIKEDEKRYGTQNNPWSRPRVCGTLPNGDCVHVYVETFALNNAIADHNKSLSHIANPRDKFTDSQMAVLAPFLV